MILTSPDQLSYKPSRITSLVPSQTELLHYLRLETETIGITKFCVHPAGWFRTKEHIGGTKTINIDKIRSLNPDLIIANKEENLKEAVEKLAEKFPVWVTDVNNLEDACGMISDIGQLTGKYLEAKNLATAIKSKFNSLLQIKYINNSLSTVYLIWNNPLMTIGGDTFISDIMKNIGLKNSFVKYKRCPEITTAQLKTMNCELVLLSSEPYPFKQKHLYELQKELPNKKIILVDGEMFSWYGSRLLLAADYLKELMMNLKMNNL